MFFGRKSLMVAVMLAAAGCHSDKPHAYGEQRTPVGELNDSGGLQSKDVQQATSQMIMELMALPELNQSSRQWTLVVSNFEDRTTDHLTNANYDIFLEDLRSAISQYGQGRIRLIENKQEFEGLRNKELEQGNADPYGQGGPGAGAPAAAAVQPDFALYGKAYDLPNRSSNFYLLNFLITNLRTREQVFSRSYQVNVAR